VTSLAHKPPDKVFCMTCGPDTAMTPEPSAGRLRCPVCGEQRQLAALPLFVVTGASGAGKSAMTGHLRGMLPGVLVFEIDLILHVAALGPDHLPNTWLQLAHEAGLNGYPVVLTGSLMPEHVERQPARVLAGPVHFAVLDCADDVRAARLRARPAWRGTHSDAAVAEHQRFAAWLRGNISPCFDTSAATPAEVAARVAAWVTGLLPARA
jgi:predicted kinase